MYTSSETLFKRIGIQFFAEGNPGSGEEGTGEDENGSSGGTPDGNGSGSSAGKTFTQAEVNQMMAGEKRSARSAILKELGYEVKDGKYSDAVKAIKDILDSGKTQQQKDKEAKDKAEGDLAAEQTKSANLQARLDVITAGIKPEFVDDAIRLLMPQVSESKTLTSLVEDYKTKYPNWFGDSGSNGTGNSTKNNRNPGNNNQGLGKRLAEAKKSNTKSSYFNH